MKKVFLLAILPALLVLSSCGRANRAPAQEYFKEDTTLHEEVFGQLNPRKLGVPDDTPGSHPEWTKTPKVGVQFKSYQKDKNDDGTPEDYFAVRFVAAIKDTEGMTATWSRGVSRKDSAQLKTMVNNKVSTVKYDSLNNAGSPSAASGEGGGSLYDKYVVYSMYDIPSDQDESYIAAYLTLSKDGEDDVVSKVIATQIDGSHYFSFDSSVLVKDGYFLENEGSLVYQDDTYDSDPEDDGKNNAKFEDVLIYSGTSFGMFRFTPSVFQFYGRETFINSSASRFVKSTTIDQYGEVYLSGHYDIYVNKDNFAYFTPESVNMDLYLEPNANWKQDGARFAVNCFGASDNDWFDMEETAADSGIYKIKDDEQIELGKYTTVIFCRMNPATSENNWSNKWNQTKDLVINDETGPANMSQLKYSIEGWDNGNGSWSALS